MLSPVETKKAAQDIREHIQQRYATPEGEDLLFLADVFVYLVHSTPVDKLSVMLRTQSNRYVLRKLKACLDLLHKVFVL